MYTALSILIQTTLYFILKVHDSWFLSKMSWELYFCTILLKLSKRLQFWLIPYREVQSLGGVHIYLWFFI